MELRHLRYFVAVAEQLHFGRAAESLNIAQPPLSQQIRRLEGELGGRLFDRTTRRVQLTDAGRAFLREARLTLAQAERAAMIVQRASRGEVGQLSLAFVPAADLRVLPEILPVFRRRFPDVQFLLRSLSGAQQVQALREGEIQAGFLFRPVEDESLATEPVLSEELLVALPQGHRLARRRRVGLRELAREPLILFPRPLAPAYYDLIVSSCHRAGFAPKVVQEADHIQTHLGLIASGLGLSLVAASVEKLRRTGVVYRRLRPPAPLVGIVLAYRRNDSSEVLAAFVDVVRSVVRENSWVRARPRSSRPAN